MRRNLLLACVVVLVAPAALAQSWGDGGESWGAGWSSWSSPGGSVAPPTCTRLVPATDPSACSNLTGNNQCTLSGTTTGSPTSVSYVSTAGAGGCSTGAGTFSCSVLTAQDSDPNQVVTVTATNAGGTGTCGGTLVFPAFQLLAGSTTPNDLPTSLRVNSVNLDLVLACDAQGVSGTSLVCAGDTLVEAGAGSSPTLSTLTPFHALDSGERAITVATTQKYYAASAAAIADITTEDFVVEFVARQKFDGASSDYVLNKRSGGTSTGWFCTVAGSNIFTCGIDDADSAATSANTGTIVAGGMGHVYFFVDRDEASTSGAVAYANGLGGSGVDMAANASTLTNATLLNVGSNGGAAGSSLNDQIVSFRVFKCPIANPQCFAGGAGGATEQAAIAKERTAIAFGVNPVLAAGIDSPTTMTRATLAAVDVVDGLSRALYWNGNNSPRVAVRSASSVAVRGYLSEPQTTNLALQSQTLGTTWAPISAGDNVLANTWTPADVLGGATGDEIDGDDAAGDAEHGLRQSITLAAVSNTLSAWAISGEVNYALLRDSTVANTATWFDLLTCFACPVGEDCPGAVGTTGSAVTQARAENWPIDSTGDGAVDQNSCRVSITFPGTAAAHDIDLMCAAGDGVLTYTDVGAAADCGYWGVEVEAFPMMTSYQSTTTVAVTRSGDDLRFDGASHYAGSPTTIDQTVLCPNFDVGTSSTFVSIGTGTTNYGQIGINATDDRPQTAGANGGAQWDFSGASGDVADGAAHAFRDTWLTNDIEGFYDTVSFGTDLSATLPTVAASFVYLGTRGSTAQQSACLLTRLRIWNRDVSVAEAP